MLPMVNQRSPGGPFTSPIVSARRSSDLDLTGFEVQSPQTCRHGRRHDGEAVARLARRSGLGKRQRRG